MRRDYNFFAFDLGATSGRSIVGHLHDGKLEWRELTRFANKITHTDGKYYWDIYALFDALKEGLKKAAENNIAIDAIGIDTWGVDFVYIGEDGSMLEQPRCYRDPYTESATEEYFKLLPQKEVYKYTGIQIMNINSLFQLFAARREDSHALKKAESILFIPDALSYLLTGKKVCEYTIASTSQMLNPRTKRIEDKLLEVMDLNPALIQPIIMPGEVIGYLTDDIADECGLGNIPVIAVAGHDTASAVAAVPAENENFAYLSSGTWSLMGIEVKEPIINEDSFQMNFTNEGGVDGVTRFLKNITGMWLLEQCREEWKSAGKEYTYPEIIALSDSAKGFESLIDPDHPSFANPASMTDAIVSFCNETNQQVPATDARLIRCIFDSLAFKYKYVLACLQKMSPFKIEKLHVIGGGSQNKLLNQMTANSTGIPVIAGPSEATAIGNMMVQAKGLRLLKSSQEIRDVVRRSISTEIFHPQNTEEWDEKYSFFLSLIKK